MRRVVDYEIRLSYYDRVVKTLPGPMADPQAGVLPAQAPGPVFAYENPGMHIPRLRLATPAHLFLADHPHFQEAQDLLSMIKGRAKSNEVTDHCANLSSSAPLQHMVMQSLLHVGARSFSHFLNAVERYLPLLRGDAGSGFGIVGEKNNSKARAILCAAGEYWALNGQMVGIVFDKLMQYQIVDPSDVIEYAFAEGQEKPEGAWLSGERWSLVEAALNKANGRVVGAKRRVAALNKEEEDRRARVIANAGGMGMEGMDVDGDTQAGKSYQFLSCLNNFLMSPFLVPAEPEIPASQSLVTAQKALEALTKDEKKVFQSAVKGFVDGLTKAGIPPPTPAEWARSDWSAWECWGWYRQFCRAVSMLACMRPGNKLTLNGAL